MLALRFLAVDFCLFSFRQLPWAIITYAEKARMLVVFSETTFFPQGGLCLSLGDGICTFLSIPNPNADSLTLKVMLLEGTTLGIK